MKMNTPKHQRQSYRKLPVAAFLLGIVSVCCAIAIGYITYRSSLNETEKHYHEFYRARARFLRAKIELGADQPPHEVLRSVEHLYRNAGEKPPDEYFCIVDSQAEIILHTLHPGTLGNNAGKNQILDSGNRRRCSIMDLVRTKQDFVGNYISSAGQPQIAAFTYIPSRQWPLGVHRSKEALLKEVSSGYRLFLLGFILVCGILIPLSLGLLYRMFQLSQKKRNKAEALIKASLKEKEILLQEIHHRVKNNMQLISSLLGMQSDQIEDEKSRRFFTNCRSRIQAMAKIHERIYKSKSLANVDFKKYIEDLTRELHLSYNNHGVELEIVTDVAEIFPGIDVSIPCAIIINELVTNAIKHAFPGRKKGKIQIAFYRDTHLVKKERPDHENYVLTVRDNGIGLPGGFAPENEGSLGWVLVRALTDQLNGRMELKVNEGTGIRITFSYPAPAGPEPGRNIE